MRAYRIHHDDDSEPFDRVVMVDDSGEVVGSDDETIARRIGTPLLGTWGYVRRRFPPMQGYLIEELDLDDPAVVALGGSRRDRPDVRDIVTVQQVARRAGVTVRVATAAVDAHLYATVAVAASGSPVVCFSGAVLGPRDCPMRRHLELRWLDYLEHLREDDHLSDLVAATATSEVPPARFVPVLESELEFVSVALAAARVPDADPADLSSAVTAWWELASERALEGRLDDAVIRRRWNRNERHFEDWFERHPDVVPGLDLDVVARQWRAPDGAIADLVFEVVASRSVDHRVGEIVIVENKATEARHADVEQLLGYMAHARAVGLGAGSRVHGLLAAPSIGHGATAAAGSGDIRTVTWGELGYLDHLWSADMVTTPIRSVLEELGASRSSAG